MRFRHHAAALVAASMTVATTFALVWTAALGIAMEERLPGAAWLVMMAGTCWVGVCLVAMPLGGIVFSALWPLTRRGTATGNLVGLAAGAAVGMIASPIASEKLHGANEAQIALFTILGASLAALYLLFLHRARPTAIDTPLVVAI